MEFRKFIWNPREMICHFLELLNRRILVANKQNKNFNFNLLARQTTIILLVLANTNETKFKNYSTLDEF